MEGVLYLVVCIMCFIVGFVLNEVIRKKSEEKIPFKEDI